MRRGLDCRSNRNHGKPIRGDIRMMITGLDIMAVGFLIALAAYAIYKKGDR